MRWKSHRDYSVLLSEDEVILIQSALDYQECEDHSLSEQTRLDIKTLNAEFKAILDRM